MMYNDLQVKNMSNDVINRDPEIMGGEPVFMGTQVPVSILMDYLETGGDLNEFLDQHPSVNSKQAFQLIRLAAEILTADAEHAAAII